VETCGSSGLRSIHFEITGDFQESSRIALITKEIEPIPERAFLRPNQSQNGKPW
jgi:hypothetical protein